ncbi:hypothetical protein [Candidatus Tisiphia endosymbiont of Ditula angustiorana]|uniref:hypothetical protein n=1 Tax=Candidatus Tisiphia endosymbiont of Ditula angustiorana TaxID=3066272 RepID=UPI00312C98EE
MNRLLARLYSTSADNFLALPTNILSARVPPSLREAAMQRLSNQEIRHRQANLLP